MGWETYKGLEVPQSSSGDAGINLTANFRELADRTAGDAGAVQYMGGDGFATSDPDKLFFNATNTRLGVGTDSPTHPINIVASVPALAFTDGTGRTLVITGPTGSNASITVDNTNAGLDVTTAGTGPITLKSNGSQRAQVTGDGSSTTLAVSGGIGTALAGSSNNITLTANHSVLLMDAVAGTITATLPTAVGCAGREYRIKKINAANSVIIATTSSQTIDGTTTRTLTSQYDRITVVSDGNNWMTL